MRNVVDGVLVSSGSPALKLRASDRLRYLGRESFELKAVADVERHIFAEAASRTVLRMLVVHFEHFLPGVRDEYRYPIENAMELAGATYGCTISELDLREELSAEPDAELAHTVRSLARHGLRLGNRHAVARLARILGHDRRSELLIFYHEIDGSTDGLLERAMSTFTIES